MWARYGWTVLPRTTSARRCTWPTGRAGPAPCDRAGAGEIDLPRPWSTGLRADRGRGTNGPAPDPASLLLLVSLLPVSVLVWSVPGSHSAVVATVVQACPAVVSITDVGVVVVVGRAWWSCRVDRLSVVVVGVVVVGVAGVVSVVVGRGGAGRARRGTRRRAARATTRRHHLTPVSSAASWNPTTELPALGATSLRRRGRRRTRPSPQRTEEPDAESRSGDRSSRTTI
jgi:hypothetical protein